MHLLLEVMPRTLRALAMCTGTSMRATLGGFLEGLAVGATPPDTSRDAATLAAWTQVARAIFNLHETITRD